MYQVPSYSQRNADSVYTGTSVVDDRFATKLIAAVKPADQQLSEEELDTLFEQAMSGRVLAISARLSRISGPLTHRPQTIGQRSYAGSLQVVSSTEPLRQRSGDGR